MYSTPLPSENGPFLRSADLFYSEAEQIEATRTFYNSDESSYKGQPRYNYFTFISENKQALYALEIPLLMDQRMEASISKLGKLLTALINPVGKG